MICILLAWYQIARKRRERKKKSLANVPVKIDGESISLELKMKR